MKKISYFFLLLFILSCQKDEAIDPEINDEIEVTATSAFGATFTAELKDMGIFESLQHGFIWGSTAGLNINSPTKIILGNISAPSEFSIRTENLEEGKTYFVRAFVADNEFSKIFYSQEVSFNTIASVSVIETLQPEDITNSSIQAKGNLINMLEYNQMQVGFVWSAQPNPDLTSAGKILIGQKTSTGNFSAIINSLNPATTYYIRAFATDPKVQAVFYGNERTFTTN